MIARKRRPTKPSNKRGKFSLRPEEHAAFGDDDGYAEGKRGSVRPEDWRDRLRVQYNFQARCAVLGGRLTDAYVQAYEAAYERGRTAQ